MIWFCHQCGIKVPMKPEEFPIHCCCGLSETYEEAVNRGGLKDAVSTRCQHLQGVKESFNGRWLACGCSRIYLYPCRHFNELVTLNAIRKPNKVDTVGDVKQGITDFHPEYQGRTCQGCKAFSQPEPPQADATILHVTHRPNWQDQKRRSEFALSQHGLRVNTVELVKPSEGKLRQAIEQHRPQIVFNHGFAGKSATTIQLARELPDIAFVTIDHSNQNHTFTWPQYFSEWKQVLEASRIVPNVWAASPDAYMPFADFGYDRYVHWPNPVYLPPAPPIPALLTDPPTLDIVGRTDWMKAFPAQISAAALVQRKRPLRVALVLNGSRERCDGLYQHAAACGLEYETVAWMLPTAWESYLRDSVSVVCQPSFSESFNYVSLDGAAFGRPFVGAESIRHTPWPWRVANPNDCYEIAAKIECILDDYPSASRLARQVAESVAERNNRQYADLIRRFL
jgi:glycosyltransferase involved in cell wall biosynthesis